MTRKTIKKAIQSFLIMTQLLGLLTFFWVSYLVALGTYERSVIQLQHMLIGKN
jgi:hypothetical protein